LEFIRRLVVGAGELGWWSHEMFLARLCFLLLRGEFLFRGSHCWKEGFGRKVMIVKDACIYIKDWI